MKSKLAIWGHGLIAFLLLDAGVTATEPSLAPPGFVINEFMAANTGTLKDNYDEWSDWIEILNRAPEARNLAGWFLTDDAGNRTKWRFPDREVGPESYVVVFASGRNETNGPAFLHANFQLRDIGEYLALVDPNINIVSEFRPVYPPQTSDVSYGRDRLDPTVVGYFSTPTPGAANEVSGRGFAPGVDFSRNSGTFPTNRPFLLSLATRDAADIFYSFGTNVPGSNTFRYAEPILVTNTTVIRARAFVPGLLPGAVSSRGYVGLSAETNVLGFTSDLPILIVHNYGQGLFPANNGPAGERWVHLQTFENPAGCGANSMTNVPTATALGVMRPQGDDLLTSSDGKASFTLELRDDYGRPRDVSLLGLPAASDWVLHAPNYLEPALFHDALAMQLARDGGEYAPRTRFFELYLKDDSGDPGAISSRGFGFAGGDYHGIYMLTEKIRRDTNRVNIAQLAAEDVAIPEVTGGYILSTVRTNSGEGTFAAGGVTLNLVEPRWTEWTNTARAPQRAYLQGFFNAFAAGLSGFNLTNATFVDGTPNTNHYSFYIDPESWVRRHIHEVLTFNLDALRTNSYYIKDRNGRIECGPPWDYDRSQGSTDGRDRDPRTWRSAVGDLGTDFFNFGPWWGALFRAPDFWQAWIDRYQRERQPGGSLTTTNVHARIDQLFEELKNAQPRERLRWGTVTRGTNGSGFGSYADEVMWKKHWFNARLQFMDTNFLEVPVLRRGSLDSESSAQVSILPPALAGCRVYYTLDGTDPRLPNGGISPRARSSDRPETVLLDSNARIAARSHRPDHRNLNGPNNPPLSSPWSGLRTLTVTGLVSTLRVTEIMYHPLAGPNGGPAVENFQFLEVRNTGTIPIAMGGIRFTQGVEFVFPPSTLEPGAYQVVVRNRAAFDSRYGPGRPVAGEFSGTLSFGGEMLTLVDATDSVIVRLTYHDRWQPLTDGPGLSLVAATEDAAPELFSQRRGWRESRRLHGSPGESEPPDGPWVRVVINELLANVAAPYEDFVELYNPTTVEADISRWYLTDDFGQPRKFQFPEGTRLEGQGYLALDEHAFNSGANSAGTGFSFGADGDEVYLYSADAAGDLTGYVHGFRFGGSGTNESFGREIAADGMEEFVRQAGLTAGQPNAGQAVASVGRRPSIVVTELMFSPPSFRPVFSNSVNFGPETEYIELKNIGDEPIQMGGATFEAGIDFEFPSLVLGPGEYTLIVRNRTVFEWRHGPGMPVAGEYLGALASEGERLTLTSAEGESLLDFAYESRWYPLTRGAGFALVLTNELSVPGDYSNPAVWRHGTVLGGTPGSPEPNPGGVVGVDRISPVVISEIQYRPPDVFVRGAWVSNTCDEFIELQNLSADPVPLFWTFTGFNPWRIEGDVSFSFPAGAVLPGAGFALVVGFDPENGADLSRFRSVHGVPAHVPVFGPWTGSLRGPGEIRLSREVGTIDRIDYEDRAPWSEAADGLGLSLQRMNPSVHGNDPFNWRAWVPSPGGPFRGLSQPPVLVRQPLDTSGALGGIAEFRAAATGGPDLAYRWLFEGRAIPGATSPVLRLANLQFGHTGDYRVMVLSGGEVVISERARLSVFQRATVVRQPTSVTVRVRPDPEAAPTTNVTFMVGAVTDSPLLAYQWRFNGRPIEGATESALILRNVTIAQFGAYSCAVSDFRGTVISGEAMLYPVVQLGIAQHPVASLTVAPGSLVGLSCVVTGFPPPFHFQWRRGSVPVASMVSSNPVTAFAFFATNAPFLTNQYRLVVSNRFSFTPGFASAFATVITGLDTDGDGILDTVEDSIPGLDKADPSDALIDVDGDGSSDRDEVYAGTDPRDSSSVLRIEAPSFVVPGLPVVPGVEPGASVGFLAGSNRVYTVEARDALNGGAWWTVGAVAATTTNRWVILEDPGAGADKQRVYRVVTPRRMTTDE